MGFYRLGGLMNSIGDTIFYIQKTYKQSNIDTFDVTILIIFALSKHPIALNVCKYNTLHNIDIKSLFLV